MGRRKEPEYDKNLPTISCVLLTYDRDGEAGNEWFNKTFLQSFGAFVNQNYPKEKLELVVVNSGTLVYKEMVRCWIDDPMVKTKYKWKVIDVEKQSIGKLRNIGLAQCTGDIIAVWDDDDISHPDRLVTQLSYMIRHKVDGCMLQNFEVVIHDGEEHRYPGYQPFGLDATLCFMNPWGDIQYEDMQQHEDTTFIDALADIGYKICACSSNKSLYRYSYHGANTMTKQHIMSMIRK